MADARASTCARDQDWTVLKFGSAHSSSNLSRVLAIAMDKPVTVSDELLIWCGMASSDAKAVALSSMISSSVRSCGSAWCCMKNEYMKAHSIPPAGFSSCNSSR